MITHVKSIKAICSIDVVTVSLCHASCSVHHAAHDVHNHCINSFKTRMVQSRHIFMIAHSSQLAGNR